VTDHVVRLLHPIAWALLVGAIVMVPVPAWQGRFDRLFAIARRFTG
jgi:hypothetical protein